MRQFIAMSHQLIGWDVSPVGEALNTNVRNYQTAHNISINSTKSQDILPGITQAIEAMIDDILIGYASAHIMVAQSTKSRPAKFTITALRFGEPKYIYTVFAINFVIVLLVFVQGVVTGLWRYLPALDCLDPRSIIVAVSNGGSSIANAMGDASGGEVSVKLDQLDGRA